MKGSSFEAGGYGFRPVSLEDLPLLHFWLGTPEVARWWGDAAREVALIEEGLGEAESAQWIVSREGLGDFAYVQAYEVHVWPQPHLDDLPAGAMAIDPFIGVPAALGRGHGPGFLAALARHLLSLGAPVVSIDPDPDNARARRAYAKAGFEEIGLMETGEGPAVLMLMRPDAD